MHPAHLHSTRGFTLLELVLVIVFISILFIFAVERLLEVRDEAERVSVQTVIGNLQSALALDLAEHVVKGRMSQIHQRIESNPMELLANAPVNYRGTIKQKVLQKAKPGYWYYNTDIKSLTYIVSNTGQFKSKLAGPARIRLKIVPIYDDLNRNEAFDPKKDQIRGVVLRFMDEFTWTGLEIYINSHII